TFLVRSGVLTSVHAFANDPERGVFILIYLMVVVGASLTLFALKAPEVRSIIRFSIVSRETLLLVNNILLTASAATVLLGTLFPLLLESLDMGMISVGPPYFNALFVPMAMLLAFALGFGVLLNWKSGSMRWAVQQTRWIFLVSLLAGLAFSLFYSDNFLVSELLAMSLVAWVLLTMARDIMNKTSNTSLLSGLGRLKPAYYGMHLAHLGLAVSIIGIAITSGYSSHRDLRMAPGDRVTVGGYEFRFDGVRFEQGPNYASDYGSMTVYHDGRQIAVLHPEKRVYKAQGMPMTEAAIDPGVTRDLYVALGERLDDEGSWALRIHIKPFVRWIWLGSIFMGLGGLLAISDRRYRLKIRRKFGSSAADASDCSDLDGDVKGVVSS
ncbi:MAG: heme lyase CcmF/NrfE family subunit, partial [Endozoicomonas sp.]